MSRLSADKRAGFGDQLSSNCEPHSPRFQLERWTNLEHWSLRIPNVGLEVVILCRDVRTRIIFSAKYIILIDYSFQFRYIASGSLRERRRRFLADSHNQPVSSAGETQNGLQPVL